MRSVLSAVPIRRASAVRATRHSLERLFPGLGAVLLLTQCVLPDYEVAQTGALQTEPTVAAGGTSTGGAGSLPGTVTGGTTGTSGGGTGSGTGSGGAAVVVPPKSCPSGQAPVWIDDMERDPVATCAAGPWFAYLSNADGQLVGPLYGEGVDASSRGIYADWSLVTPRTYASAGIAFSFYPGHSFADLSDFKAIRFSARASNSETILVMARTVSALPADVGGTCTPEMEAEENCYAFPASTVTVTETWHEYVVCFSELEHPGFGIDSVAEVPSQVVGFGFENQSGFTGDYSLYLDDIQLVDVNAPEFCTGDAK